MSGCKARVAFICDSPVLRLVMQRQLLSLDYACSGFEKNPGNLVLRNFDFVFVELMHYEENGFSLIRWLGLKITVPLILVTGTGRESDLHWGNTTGAAAVLARPLCKSALVQVLEQGR